MPTSRLRLQKMMAFLTSLRHHQLAQHFALGFAIVGGKFQPLHDGAGGGGLGGDFDALGIVEEVLGQSLISGGMVAEKNKVWRAGGSRPQIRSISGMKPMSSIRSASSITRISTALSRSLPRP